MLRALGTKQDARFNLKIVNTDEGGEAKREEKPAEAKEEVSVEPVEEVEDDEVEEESSSELAEKTRAELADLDDLDI